MVGRMGLIAGRRGPEPPRPRELATVLHDDAALAVEPRLHLLDAVEIHQLGAIHAHELLRVKLLHQTLQRSSNGVRLSAGVQLNIIAVGSRPFQPLHWKKYFTSAFLHQQALDESSSFRWTTAF